MYASLMPLTWLVKLCPSSTAHGNPLNQRLAKIISLAAERLLTLKCTEYLTPVEPEKRQKENRN